MKEEPTICRTQIEGSLYGPFLSFHRKDSRTSKPFKNQLMTATLSLRPSVSAVSA